MDSDSLRRAWSKSALATAALVAAVAAGCNSSTGGSAGVATPSHPEAGGSDTSGNAAKGADADTNGAQGGPADSRDGAVSGPGSAMEAGAGGESGVADAYVGDGATSAPTLPAVTSVDADGPFATTQDLAGGPQGASGVFYPTELGKNGLNSSIFLWGCGGGSTPSQYTVHMNRIASHGFVAVADVTTTAADGAPLKASLEWILGENDRSQSVFYHKLDTAKIAVGGHSIGSVNAFAIANDPRFTTSIHVAGGSLDGMGSGAKSLTHPAAYICAEQDVFGNVSKAQADYDITTVPVFFTVMTGVDHVGAATSGLPAIVAWLRWHLGGETQRRNMFLDPMGEFQTGIFVSKTKNW